MDESFEKLRQEIAACSRMLVDEKILNYSGHISARIPSSDAFLIQRVHDVRSELVPDRLVVVGLDGRALNGNGRPPGEVFIHSEIYRSRPDVGSVGHFHHDPTTVFSVIAGVSLVPVKNHASRWISGIPIHRDSSQIVTPDQGREVAETLGDGNALLLRGHGEVIVAEDTISLFVDVVHFVENAQTLILASQLGTVTPLTREELAPFIATFHRRSHVQKLWKYYTATAASRGVIPKDWVLDQDDPIADPPR